MKTRKILVVKSLIISSMIFIIISCASMFIEGGELVNSGYQPDEILLKYSVVGIAPEGVEYWLVRNENGIGIFERSSDGSGVIFQNQWRDEKGTHYVGWVKGSHAWEFIVPENINEHAVRYVYPAGFYLLKNVRGVVHPAPTVEIDPVARLIPVAE